MAWYLDRADPVDLDAACTRYLQERVTSQVHYFRAQLRRTSPRLFILRAAAAVSTVVAIPAAIMTLGLASTSGVYHGAKLAAIMLPLLSAAILSWVVGQDYSRRAVRYTEMIARLEEAARRLQAARTWHTVTTIAIDTEDALLRELTEWHSVSRFASTH